MTFFFLVEAGILSSFFKTYITLQVSRAGYLPFLLLYKSHLREEMK